ncbi:MAG: spermidine/putrescine ABC transporter ATP-binding protein [Deltaproteobacteria bacterium]|nr:MAG: spermidine/putrescine ABC transporter ATP-binding protein [Deltaproteobacteria bacterium]
MSKELVLENLTKKFGELIAVNKVNLEVKEGEFVCFLGPSGCGKTTILRMITGFEIPTDGKIWYDGKVINDLIPQKRNFGIVFQSYALFPNMTVGENIAFGLKMRKFPKNIIESRVEEMLNLVGLTKWKDYYPAQLSGGQQQRVALVRALAPNPNVLLLDEPLSALDAKIRIRLRAEIKRLQNELGKTMIYVTHDQEEALSIADKVVVMEAGVFEQVGTPLEIYQNPKTSFVADFVGTSNFFKGVKEGSMVRVGDLLLKVASANGVNEDRLILAIRPEKIEVGKRGTLKKKYKENIFSGRLDVATFMGVVVRLMIELNGNEVITDVLYTDYEELGIKNGESLEIYLPPNGFMVFPDK